MKYLSCRLEKTFNKWIKVLGASEIDQNEEIFHDHELYYPSRELQFILEEIFSLIIKKAKIKSGEYRILEEPIYANAYHFQSLRGVSKQFGNEINLGLSRENFTLTFSLSNIDCIDVQRDTWWKTLLKLIGNYEFHHWDDDIPLSNKKDTILKFLKKILSSDLHDHSGLGLLVVRWGNPLDFEQSIDEGVMIFKAIHELNHSLYRTRYIRDSKKNRTQPTY
ncbi:MAG: hypothetical protein D3918_03005 [Candidatus Electrothrix sp. AX2]|nr:hypothetical protein [Candidatus Electrothrix gigas]